MQKGETPVPCNHFFMDSEQKRPPQKKTTHNGQALGGGQLRRPRIPEQIPQRMCQWRMKSMSRVWGTAKSRQSPKACELSNTLEEPKCFPEAT
jgi:hypothetical protein